MERRPATGSARHKRSGRTVGAGELRSLSWNPDVLASLASSHEVQLSKSASDFKSAVSEARGSAKHAWAPPLEQRLSSTSSRFTSPEPILPPYPGASTAGSAKTLSGRAESYIHQEHLESLRKKFELQGSLSLEEFMVEFDRLFGLSGKNDEDIRTLFHKIDYNCDGRIVWDEFCSYMHLELHEREDAQSRARQVEFKTPAVLCRQGPHRDALCRIRNFSDGTLISCSQDGALCMWSLGFHPKRTRKTETGLLGKHKWVTDMALCLPQSKILLTTGKHEIQFYEMVNFEPYCQLYRLESVPLRASFWHDPEDHNHCIILIGDKEGAVTVIECLNILEAFKYWKQGVKSEDGMPTYSIDKLVSGAITGTKIYRWRVHSSWVSEVHYFPGLSCFASCCSSDSVKSLVVGSPCGSTPLEALLSSSIHGGVSRWASRSMSKSVISEGGGGKTHYGLPAKQRSAGDQRVFRVHKGVSSVDYCPKNNVLVTGSIDQVIRIWNPFVCSKPVAVLLGHEAPVFFVQVDSARERIYSVGNDNTVNVWHIVDHNCLSSVIPSAHKVSPSVEAVHFNPVLQQLAMGTEQLSVLQVEIPFRVKTDIVQSHMRSVVGVRHSKCFNQVITASEEAVVKVWELGSGECVFEFTADTEEAGTTCIDVDHSGRRLVTGAQNGQVKLWSYNNGHCINTLDKGNPDEVTDIKFVSVKKNRYIVAVGWDRKVSVFADTVGNFQHVQRPIEGWSTTTEHSHGEDILAVAFGGPHLMATASFDGEIIVWSMISCNILCRIKARRPKGAPPLNTAEGDEAIQKVLFLDKRTKSKVAAGLVASGPAGFIHFWNVYNSSVPMGCFRASQSSSITTMAVDNTNSVLISGDNTGFVSLWNIRDYCISSRASHPPQRICHWRAHTERITCMELIEEWNVLVTGSMDSAVRLWTLEGHYIGTFGQADRWRLGDPSTYQHPFSPTDVLTDPTSVPPIALPDSTVSSPYHSPSRQDHRDDNILSIVDVDSEDEEEEDSTTVDSDSSIEELITFKFLRKDKEKAGKRLRQYRRNSARQISTPGVYARLPLQDLPNSKPPARRY